MVCSSPSSLLWLLLCLQQQEWILLNQSVPYCLCQRRAEIVDEHTASGGAELFLSIIVGASLQKSNSLLVNVKIEADVATCNLLFSDVHRLLQTDFFLLSSHFIPFLFRWLDPLGIIGGYWC